jgi:hypothetical protein
MLDRVATVRSLKVPMRKTPLVLTLAALLLPAVAPARAQSGPDAFSPSPAAPTSDTVAPTFVPAAWSPQAVSPDEFTGDPLRIVVWPNDVRRYSTGTDIIGVYVCTWGGASGGLDLNDVTATLNTQVNAFYRGLSGNAYNPQFIARAVVTSNPNSFYDCADQITAAAAAHPLWADAGAFAALDNQSNAGLGGPGNYCYNCETLSDSTFPGNQRWAVVDGGAVKAASATIHLTTAAHEIGHMISFPHSYSGETDDQYDNPIDYMSGNMPASLSGRASEPYSSLAFNRYRAGWIDPADVVFYAGGVTELTLAPVGVDGTQMVVMPTSYPYSFVVLDARVTSMYDPIPTSFEGVSAHYVEQWCKDSDTSPVEPCGGLPSRPYTYPPSPYSLDHVTALGGRADFDLENKGEPLLAQGARLTVLSENADGYVIRLVGFDDIAGSVFRSDVLWLADAGITTGCTDTGFCPADNVTRGQMAAFLARALNLTDDGGGNTFTDDDGSIFEADIAKLAAAGITRGCNPPDNTEFCPNAPVTREQMAAFLVRALNLTEDGGGNTFIDDDFSVFQEDIARLAAAGITKGCNPPDNTRFCPTDPVSRQQMAAFLNRALN